MRNSIQGPLLRTGNNSSFKALGETGYPVFKMAVQLREAINRLDAGRDLARHLAVPQNDQGGDRTDWYSSIAGDVIPWSGATQSERASARQQFNDFQLAVQALSEQMLNSEQNGAGGDRRVFAQLLKSVVHFPDDEFLYLVNGVLVITFWGFIHPTDEQRNPMHWLQPSSVPMPTPVAPVAQPITQPGSAHIHTTETETVARGNRWNWRWLLWLLLALLLLALLLGLLRGCAPSISLTGLPGASTDKSHHQPEKDRGTSKTIEELSPVNSSVDAPVVIGSTHSATRVPIVNSSDASPALEGTRVVGNSAVTHEPIQQVPDPASEASNPVSNSAAAGSQPGTNTAPPAISEAQNSVSQHSPVAPNNLLPATPAQGEPLTLPASLPDGPAQFLNGQWRVNGGIQDKLTGRPLQLQYSFDQGNGTVSVRQSDGVTCTGKANGSVQHGALNITNPEQMQCSDGSNFIGPTIECKSPASGHADCVGNNDGDNTFPIRMLKPNT